MVAQVETAVWGEKIMQVVGLSQTARPQVYDSPVPLILPSVKKWKCDLTYSRAPNNICNALWIC